MTARAFLLVDAGNTTVKSALIASQDISLTCVQDFKRLNNSQASVAQLCGQWSDLADSLKVVPQTVDLVWASVGPSAIRQVIEQAFKAFSDKLAPMPEVARAEQVLPAGNRRLRNAYDEPAQLGVDRWLSALGMASLVGDAQLGTHVIVSAGTATTIDVITVCRQAQELQIEFSGGWILPGYAMMQASLRAGTAGLGYEPTLATQGPWTIPRNSSNAIGHGIALAQSGFLGPIAQALDVQQLWLHGGACEQWKQSLELTELGKLLGKKILISPALALQGLACSAACR